MTYRQSRLLGGQVRKGEKSTIAIFYKSYGKEVADPDTGEETTETRRVLKSYPIFNADQIDDLPERFHPKPAATPKPIDADRLAEITTFFERIPAATRHGGDEAFYDPVGDYIQLPHPDTFIDADHYGATRAHECVHNAATRIMPHGVWLRPILRASAMRLFGIIRALRETRGACRPAGTGPTRWSWIRLPRLLGEAA